MNEILPQPHHTHQGASNSEKTASLGCPQCESAISRDDHYCAKCGAELFVCCGCNSPNVGYPHSCRVCGQPMLLSPAPEEITKILDRKTQDLDILDQAANAIIKLRKIIESIERLELAHQIERAQTVSIAGEQCSKGRLR